jgi:hypothetical protein
MDTEYVVIGVLQLAVGIGWTGLALVDRRRPPDQRRNFKESANLQVQLILGVIFALIGLYWLGRGLWG